MKTFKQFITEQEHTLQQNVERLKQMRQNQDAFLSGKIGLKDIDKPFDPSTKPDVSQPSSVDYTGSRYDLGGGQSIDPSSISNKPNAKRELGLRKDYRSPPGYGTSAFEKARERMTVKKAQELDAGVFPELSGVVMPGTPPYNTRYADPLKTPPAVPKTTVNKVVPKPKLRPTQEPAVPPPKPKLRPLDNTKQAVSIPEPKSMDLNFTSKGKKQAVEPKAPISKASEQDVITIKDKNKIWNIAGGDPKRVKEILKLNPGLNPNKMPIGYKLKLK